jgi:hypothetical protein
MNVNKIGIIVIVVLIIILGILGIMIINKEESIRKEEEKKSSQIIDFKELYEFTFYYHTHDGKPAIHKRIYVSTKSEETALSQYLIKDQRSSSAHPYYDRLDSLSMATLDTLSIGHNYPCKMFQLQWKGKIIWRKK